MSSSAPSKFLWCVSCRRSFSPLDSPDGRCPLCGSEMKQTGKYAAIFRGLMATELSATDLRSKHRQLIRLIWTRNGAGERYFKVLAPDMTYSKFEARVTDLICRGVDEGWATIVIPPAPTVDEGAYRIEFSTDEQFVEALERLAESTRKKKK